MIIVASSAVASIEDFSKDTLGRYEYDFYSVQVVLSSSVSKLNFTNYSGHFRFKVDIYHIVP